MNKILIIDDDARLVKNLSTYLKDFNYQTDAAYNGTEGLKKIESFSPDLVILDLMMPEIDGLDVCREIRKTRSVPVIMLTARGEEPDIVAGLEVGADDYLTKPFSLRELQARIKARLRQPVQAQDSDETEKKTISCRGITLDPLKRVVSKNGVILTLTGTEFNLLWLMMSQPGVVFSRDRLLDELRNRELEAFDRSIDAHISHLRKKVEDSPKNPSCIVTVWGTGYKFMAE